MTAGKLKTMVQIRLSDLEKLSKDELLSIATQVEKIKESQKRRTQEFYLKNAHQDQLDFHKCPKRGKCFLGGNRSGKTTGGVNEFIWRNMGTHPFRKCRVPIKSFIVLQDFENHGKNILEAKLAEWLPSGALAKPYERNQTGAIKKIYWKTGSVTDVYSHDQDPKVFEGSDYDYGWFDEPPPHRIFKAIFRGLTDRGGDFTITATPIVEPWLYDFFRAWEADPEKSFWWFRYVNSYSNARNLGDGDAALGKKRLDEFASTLDEDEKESRIGGKFLNLSGLVFKNWSRAVHLIQPFAWPAQWPILESIDPHPQKDWAVSWIGVAENNAKILLRSGNFPGDAIEVGNAIMQERMQIEIEDGRRPRITNTYIDNYASAPLMTRSFVDPQARRTTILEEIQSVIGPPHGPRIMTSPKNVAQKIEIFKGWLTTRERQGGRIRPDFYAFDNRENDDFIKEIEGYVWARYRTKDRSDFKDQPVKRNDDILDTIMQVALTLGEKELGVAKPINYAERNIGSKI